MKIFDQVDPWPKKVNFVDENNVALGYDLENNCCEYAEWFIADAIITEIPDYQKDLPALKSTGIKDLAGWTFDKTYFKRVEISENEKNDEYDGGGIAIFRITNGNSEKFIHLFNCHNGYYSHGFAFSEGEKIIKEDLL